MLTRLTARVASVQRQPSWHSLSSEDGSAIVSFEKIHEYTSPPQGYGFNSVVVEEIGPHPSFATSTGLDSAVNGAAVNEHPSQPVENDYSFQADLELAMQKEILTQDSLTGKDKNSGGRNSFDRSFIEAVDLELALRDAACDDLDAENESVDENEWM